jgi:pyruvate, water dikinase
MRANKMWRQKMKKNVWILFFLGITVLLFSQEAMVCGDVNEDGDADILDALLIAQHYVGFDVFINTTFADVDCNSTIDIIDALLIARMYVGLILIDCHCMGLPCSGVPLDLELNENQDYSFFLRDRDDYELFSNQISETDRSIIEVKFVIMDIQNNPTLYFMNANRNIIHYDFTVNVLGNTQTYEEFCSVTYYNTNKQNIGGTIIFYEHYEVDGITTGIYSLEFCPTYHIRFIDVERAYQMITCKAAFLNPDNFWYQPVGPVQEFGLEDELDAYTASGIPILETEDLYKDITFTTLNSGEGIGLLRVYGDDPRPLTVRDIVILDTIPNDISHVGGMITTLPQTPLSHINLKAKQNDTPNIYIKDALDNQDIMQYLGEYVYFKADTNGFEIRQASYNEYINYLANIRPTETQYPPRDLNFQEITSLYNIDFYDSVRVGAKAANVAELLKILPDGMVPRGYAVPFYYYDRFMQENQFYQYAINMMAEEEFQNDPGYREDALKLFRDMIEDAPVSSEIAETLDIMHKSFPEGTSLRCRSSTNNEDLEGFSGAGLYDSKTHHPDEGHITKTIKEIWAGLWTFRAFEEREFYRVDHFTAAMGVLVHPNFENELVNGVSVTKNIYDPYVTGFYVNAQLGEDLVTNPEERSIPEAFLMMKVNPLEIYETVYLSRSNKIPEGEYLLNSTYIDQLTGAMETIHQHFAQLYSEINSWDFAVDLEFKVTSEGDLAIKQARPWVD